MARYRSILVLFLALVTTLLVSCSSPAAVKAPTYTSTQLEQIQTYKTGIATILDRLPELAPLITNRKWTDVKTFIHGPLGDLRVKLLRLSRTLLPNEQKQAQQLSQDIFEHLVKIDEAADVNNYAAAIRNYNDLIKNLEEFFKLVPNSSPQ